MGRSPRQVSLLCGDGSQSPTQQLDTDGGVPWASPRQESHVTPPKPAPSLLPPPAPPAWSPRPSSLAEAARRARFNWGLRDVRTWGPGARARGRGARLNLPRWQPRISAAQWAQRAVIKIARCLQPGGRLWAAPRLPVTRPALPPLGPAVLAGVTGRGCQAHGPLVTGVSGGACEWILA